MSGRATNRDWQVFRSIAAAESEPRPPCKDFAEVIRVMDRLLQRDSALFGEPAASDEDEFRSHEEIYVRARQLGHARS